MTSFSHYLIHASLFASLVLFAACGGETNPPTPSPTEKAKSRVTPPNSTDDEDPSDSSTSNDPSSTSNKTPSDPVDPNNPASTPFSAAHVVKGCSPTIFQINLGTLETKCSTLWLQPDDIIQVTVGETDGLPPANGRTYTVKSHDKVDIYPEDGEAIAIVVKDLTSSGDSFPVAAGTLVIDTRSANKITGKYSVTLDNGDQLSSKFSADICPDDPGSCD